MKNFINKTLAVLMGTVLLVGFIPTVTAQAANDIKITVNGQELKQTKDIGFAEIVDSRTFVPLRLVTEELGFVTDWQKDGPKIITMSNKDKTVYHMVGKLEATSVNPLHPDFTSADILGKTEVKSYIDKDTGRTMVALRLISEAFGAEVKWAGATRTVAISMDVEPVDQSDVIKLDENNSVLRSTVINRISQQEVINSDSKFGMISYRTIAEQAKVWEPKQQGVDMSSVIGRPVLVERAKGYIEGYFNIDTETMTADQWTNQFFNYTVNVKTDNRVNLDKWRKTILNWYPGTHDRKFQVETVFVTDESLVYVLEGNEALLNRSRKEIEKTPWAVRGTMFYKVNWIEEDSKFLGVDAKGIETGQWYWYDMEIRFGVNDNDGPNFLAMTQPTKTIYIDKKGSYVPVGIVKELNALSSHK